jgi:hypothetical protein
LESAVFHPKIAQLEEKSSISQVKQLWYTQVVTLQQYQAAELEQLSCDEQSVSSFV